MNPWKALLTVTAVLSFSPLVASEASSQSVLVGCRDKVRRWDFYPVKLMAKGIEGRVLMEVERKTDGSLAIVKFVESTPNGAFDEAAGAFIANLQCQAIDTPRIGKFGLVFSFSPNPGVAGFKGVDAVNIQVSRPAK